MDAAFEKKLRRHVLPGKEEKIWPFIQIRGPVIFSDYIQVKAPTPCLFSSPGHESQKLLDGALNGRVRADALEHDRDARFTRVAGWCPEGHVSHGQKTPNMKASGPLMKDPPLSIYFPLKKLGAWLM